VGWWSYAARRARVARRRDVDVDEAVPVVELSSTTKKDARAFPVSYRVPSRTPGTRSVSIGFHAVHAPLKFVPERRVRVNGSGEGGILVRSESVTSMTSLHVVARAGHEAAGCFVTNLRCAKTASVRFEGHHAAGFVAVPVLTITCPCS
jgi:hypothetical protein